MRSIINNIITLYLYFSLRRLVLLNLERYKRILIRMTQAIIPCYVLSRLDINF